MKEARHKRERAVCVHLCTIQKWAEWCLVTEVQQQLALGHGWEGPVGDFAVLGRSSVKTRHPLCLRFEHFAASKLSLSKKGT